MHKVLIVGSDKIFAIENFYSKYLKEFGVNIDKFCASDLFIDYYEASIFNKLIVKAGLSSIYKTINKKFKQKIKDYRPDIILVFKGMEVLPDSLVWAKSRNIKLVNYNPDNPFIFSGKGSGNRNVTDSIALYDLHLTYDHWVKKKVEQEYHLKAEILPFAFDDDDTLFNECCRQQEVVKLCFLGNPDFKRAAFIKALAEEGIAIDVFGIGWKNFLRHSNIKLFDPALGIETWKTLRRYRVQLNLMRAHNENSHNMRTFEVPGIGGIMVAPDTEDHRVFFKDGEEIFLYKDVAECAVIIRNLLNIKFEEANKLRKNARKRSLSSGYSYKERARLLWDYLKTLNGKSVPLKSL